VKKETLKLSNGELEDNALLFAISSSESDIRICQLINNALGINLALTSSLEILQKKLPTSFRQYSYESPEEIEKYTLIVNRNEGKVLFRVLEKIDFFLLVVTESPMKTIENSFMKLKNSPLISAIYKVDQTSLKAFNRLLF
jgi:hypothetical protein